MKSGIYEGKGKGFDWIEPVTVNVSVDQDRIKSIEVVDAAHSRETHPYLNNVIELMVPRIIDAQTLGVDSITGATMSSSGVKGAVRDALKKAIAADNGDPAELQRFEKKVEKKTDTVDLNYRIVVVGMAGAGMSAALTAAEEMKKNGQEVSVLAIETSGKIGTMPAEFFGINPPKYCAKYNEGKPYFENPEELYDLWVRQYNHGDCKKDLIRLLFDQSGECIDWLEFDHRCYMHSAMRGFGECKWLCKYRFQLSGSWEEGHVYDGLRRDWDRYEAMDFYYRRLTADYVALGGKYMLETTGYEVLYDRDSRKVTGVRARRYDGTEYVIHADVVISCTGGFEGNADMVEKYLSNEYHPLKSRKWRLYGMYQNKGQIIQSAIDNGAATYNIGMSPIVHLKAPAGMVTKYPYFPKKEGVKDYWSINDAPCSIGLQEIGIRIGPDGRRTHDESGMFAHWVTGPEYFSVCGTDYLRELAEKGFEKPNAQSVAAQQNASKRQGFTIPDSNYTKSARINCYGGVPYGMPIPEIYDIMEEGVRKGFVYKADTLGELAAQIGVPADALRDEIARYNGFCEKGVDEDFGKKPQYLKLIAAEGPYYAVKCKSTPYGTMAALDVNRDINVLDTEGNVMNGLYACGNDSEGVLYAPDVAYAQYGGIALSWAFTSGRVAAKNAVKYISGLK